MKNLKKSTIKNFNVLLLVFAFAIPVFGQKRSRQITELRQNYKKFRRFSAEQIAA